MVTAGMLLGGAGVAAATGSGASTTPTSTTTSTTSSPATTTSTTTTSTSTSTSTTTSTSSSPTTTTSSPTTTTSSPTTTTSSPTTTTSHPSGPKGSATAQVGCLGEVSVVVSGTELAEGTVVDVQLTDGVDTATVQAEVIGGRIAVVLAAADLEGLRSLGVLVQVPGSDAVYVYTVSVHPLTDVCTATGSIALARDCTTPNTVLATVQASGLTAGGTYGISVVGTSPSGAEVVLGSADVVSVDGTLAGTLPLTSITGTVPLEGFTGIALLIDGQVFASVGANEVSVGTCVTPQPLPVAPAHPVVSTTSAAPTTPAAAKPAALAQTGAEPGGLLLLAGLFLGLGGLTTFVARRTAR